MRDLLAIASARAEQAEVYTRQTVEDRVEFADKKLHRIESSRLAGTALRIIVDGKAGQSWTRRLTDPEGMVANAFASLAGDVPARYRFPRTGSIETVEAYDLDIERITTEHLAEECARVHGRLAERVDGDLAVFAIRTISRFGVRNSAGTDLSHRTSHAMLFAGVVLPGTASGFRRLTPGRTLGSMPDAVIDEIAALYRAARREARPKSGRMKVLFLPSSLITLTWRLLAGTSGKSVYEGVSPISGGIGEQVVSERITFFDDPADPLAPEPRSFDDEGVAATPFTLIEDGVLRGFYNDLDHAAKLGVPPTGHGYRRSMWGGDAVTIRPNPHLSGPSCQPGEAGFQELVAMMDRGIILESVLGAHSGNIPNGDYSVGVNPALYVENGEIVGRLKDAMVAGNAYETLREVVAVGKDVTTGFGGQVPAILCDNVSVACG